MEINPETLQLSAFTDLLFERKILPIEVPSWNHTMICHGPECLDHYKAKSYPAIRSSFNNLNKKAGVYAYYSEGSYIYIGVSKDMRERIYQHLLESCPGPYGNARYKEAFGKYPGLINFYYLPLGDQSREGDYLRTIVEKVLQVHLKPELRSIKI